MRRGYDATPIGAFAVFKVYSTLVRCLLLQMIISKQYLSHVHKEHPLFWYTHKSLSRTFHSEMSDLSLCVGLCLLADGDGGTRGQWSEEISCGLVADDDGVDAAVGEHEN